MGWRLKADRIYAGYGGEALTMEISFEVEPGECVLLCGANGTGKSTLLRTVAGLEKPVKGRVELFSDAGKGRAVLVPSRVPKVSGFRVERFIGLSSFRDTDWLGRIDREMGLRIAYSMKLLGIENLAGRDISTLSDGEFQKACIAAAVVRKADVILLDEPTAFLDVDTRENVLAALRTLTDAPRGAVSVIFSSHDISSAERHCTRVFGLFRDGGVSSFIDSGRSASSEAIGNVLHRCFSSL